MTRNASDVEDVLKKFITSELLEGHGTDLTSTTPLLELGIIDSLSMFTVLAFVDREFGIRIDESELNGTNFKNLKSIAALVLRTGPGAQ